VPGVTSTTISPEGLRIGRELGETQLANDTTPAATAARITAIVVTPYRRHVVSNAIGMDDRRQASLQFVPSSSVAAGLPIRMLSLTVPGKMNGRCETYEINERSVARGISEYGIPLSVTNPS